MSTAVSYEGVPPQELMRAFLRKKRMSHAYLLEGPYGTGKKNLALWTSCALMCLQPLEDGTPCEACINCRRIDSNQHPDVVEIKPDGLSIKVEQIRFLKSEFSKSGMESAQKILIIEEAEKMTQGAANSLLKFLEEPDGKVTIFLLTTAKNRLLPTILSRCQILSFHAGPTTARRQELVKSGVPENRAALFVQLTNDLQQAMEWNNDEWYQGVLPLLWRWISMLQKKDAQSFVFVQTDLMPILKERPFQQRFFDVMILFYRELLFYHYGHSGDIVFPEYAKELEVLAKEQSGKEIADSLSFLLRQKKKLDSNVAMQGLLEQFSLEAIE